MKTLFRLLGIVLTASCLLVNAANAKDRYAFADLRIEGYIYKNGDKYDKTSRISHVVTDVIKLNPGEEISQRYNFKDSISFYDGRKNIIPLEADRNYPAFYFTLAKLVDANPQVFPKGDQVSRLTATIYPTDKVSVDDTDLEAVKRLRAKILEKNQEYASGEYSKAESHELAGVWFGSAAPATHAVAKEIKKATASDKARAENVVGKAGGSGSGKAKNLDGLLTQSGPTDVEVAQMEKERVKAKAASDARDAAAIAKSRAQQGTGSGPMNPKNKGCKKGDGCTVAK